MPWSAVANSQTVSFNNLQDAVNNSVFVAKATIPSSNECVTKAEADTYVRIDTNNAGYSAKSSNQLILKSDLTALFGVVFEVSSGLYPVSGTASTCSGMLYNYNPYVIYIRGLFNSGGRNTGTISNDNIYFNFPDNPNVPTERLYFSGLSITSFGQNIYTNVNTDQIFAGCFPVSANGGRANITIDKYDGFGSGTTLRLAYSNTINGTYTAI